MILFELVSLDGVKFSEEVYEVLLPTLDGEIGVLPGHMSLISVAKHGVVSIRKSATDKDDMMERFAINGGVIEVADNVLRVLVDSADHDDEINEQEAQKAFELAQKMVSEATDALSLQQAQSMVDRQASRLQVAALRRRPRQ
jgi:F-type H+-transporting ATPase subunit epsilon